MCLFLLCFCIACCVELLFVVSYLSSVFGCVRLLLVFVTVWFVFVFAFVYYNVFICVVGCILPFRGAPFVYFALLLLYVFVRSFSIVLFVRLLLCG